MASSTEALTSAPVKGCPLWNVTPCRSVNSQVSLVDVFPALGERRGQGRDVLGLDSHQGIEDLLLDAALDLRRVQIGMPVGPERLGDEEADLALAALRDGSSGSERARRRQTAAR